MEWPLRMRSESPLLNRPVAFPAEPLNVTMYREDCQTEPWPAGRDESEPTARTTVRGMMTSRFGIDLPIAMGKNGSRFILINSSVPRMLFTIARCLPLLFLTGKFACGKGRIGAALFCVTFRRFGQFRRVADRGMGTHRRTTGSRAGGGLDGGRLPLRVGVGQLKKSSRTRKSARRPAMGREPGCVVSDESPRPLRQG